MLPEMPEEMRRNLNVPYMVGRCSGEGDALLTATIPIYLKAGLLDGFSSEAFQMVMSGTMARFAPQFDDKFEQIIDEIIETYRDQYISDEKYFFSEIFCKWWGDLMIGLGSVKRVREYSKLNTTFQYEMQLVPRHSHDPEYSGKLQLKPKWSRCDHCDDTCE